MGQEGTQEHRLGRVHLTDRIAHEADALALREMRQLDLGMIMPTVSHPAGPIAGELSVVHPGFRQRPIPGQQAKGQVQRARDLFEGWGGMGCGLQNLIIMIRLMIPYRPIGRFIETIARIFAPMVQDYRRTEL